MNRITVVEGHLTAKDRRALKYLLENPELSYCWVNQVRYTLTKDATGQQRILSKTIKDRGLIPCPGSALRWSTYKTVFTTLNETKDA